MDRIEENKMKDKKIIYFLKRKKMISTFGIRAATDSKILLLRVSVLYHHKRYGGERIVNWKKELKKLISKANFARHRLSC